MACMQNFQDFHQILAPQKSIFFAHHWPACRWLSHAAKRVSAARFLRYDSPKTTNNGETVRGIDGVPASQCLCALAASALQRCYKLQTGC